MAWYHRPQISKFWHQFRENWFELMLFGLVASWPFIPHHFLITPETYTSGKFSPWQSQIVHIWQFILIVAIVCRALQKYNYKTLTISAIGIPLILLLPQTTSLILLVIALILMQCQASKNKHFLQLMILLTASQSLIAIGQFIGQSDLGLQLINEPHIADSIKGIAKLDLPWLGQTIVRSYGTFAHPNILSATIGLCWLYFANNKTLTSRQKIILTGLCCLGLFSTMSRHIIYLLVTALIYFRKNLKQLAIPLILICITTVSIFAIRYSSPHTINSDQERLAEYSSSQQQKILPWNQQPIHNIYRELWQQYGAISLIILIVLAINIYYKKLPAQLIYLLLIGLTDHFLITLPISGFLLLLASLIPVIPITSSHRLFAFRLNSK